MTLAAVGTASAHNRSTVGVWRVAQSAAVVSVGLYAFAVAVRLWAIGLISFPITEGSAYYVAVARNLAAGRGLLIDSLWSYSTPPLTLPRPAFELWQPMATFVAAIPMALLGSFGFGAAQLGGVVLGAVLAPLAWLVARDAARRLELPERRAWFVAVGAGVLTAVAGPFLLTTAMPDSSLPFAVFTVAACVAMPAAAAGDRRAMVALDLLLGLAYLTRLEAVWLGFAYMLVVVAHRPNWRTALQRVAAPAVVAALVSLPWWLRNLSVFGIPFSGQVADNVFLTRNEQIFWFTERPTLDGFLAQGLPQIVGSMAAAVWHNFVNVLLVPAAPIVAVALITLAFAASKRGSLPVAFRRGSLVALLLAGALTFVATTVLFPVATLWGTFEHASGPLLVALTVAAVLGGDAFVAWLVRRRQWARENAWMAPAALLAVTLPIAVLQLGSAARQARTEQATIAAVAANLPAALAAAGIEEHALLITDRPIWLSDAMGTSTLALPDEPVSAVLGLVRTFGARAVVLLESRGRYPAELAGAGGQCFAPLAPETTGGATVYVIDRECVQ